MAMRACTKNRHIPLDEKLLALQQADPRRRWSSLDDTRFCALCEKVITGRMIDAWQDGKGSYHLHCPSAGCSGSPRDWFPHSLGRTSRSVNFGTGPAFSLDFALS